jgi:hypothetical protein
VSNVENSKENLTPKGLQPSTWKRNGHSQTLMRNAAVALAEWGAYVLPTHGVVKSKEGGYECSCDAYSRKQAAKRKRQWTPCTKIGKVPWGLKWQDDATNDSEVAYDIWSERKHHFSNIGILCGAKSGLVGLDIDGEVGLASLKALEEKFGALPRTVTVKTGSGGRHFWFRLPPGVEISNSAKALGAVVLGIESTNVDVRGTNGQLIAPPSMHKSGNQYEFLDGCGVDDIPFDEVPYLPQWLVDECEKAKAGNHPKAKSETKAKASTKNESGSDAFVAAAGAMPGGGSAPSGEGGVEHFLSLIGDHEGGAGFEDPIYRAACSYFARNGIDASSASIFQLLRDRISTAERDPNKERGGYDDDAYLSGRIEQARGFIDANRPSNRFPEIDNIFTFESKKAGFDFLNSFVARVTGSKTMLFAVEHIQKGTTQRCVDFLTTQGARDRFVEYRYFAGLDKEGKPIFAPLFKAWFESHEKRTFNHGITFDPSGAVSEKYNLFGGYAVEEDRKASWERLKRHLLLNICGGNVAHMLWTISWLAQMLQEPHKRPGSALVIRGGKGCGKSTLGIILSKIFGKHATTISDREHLTGRFNLHLAEAILVVAEEAVWAKDHRAAGNLKTRITSLTQTAEGKGTNAISDCPNHNHIIFLSNEANIFPATEDERRAMALDALQPAHPKSPEHEAYFSALYAEIAEGAAAALLHDLMRFDFSRVDLRRPPDTELLRKQIAANLEDDQLWLVDAVESGAFEDHDGNKLVEVADWGTKEARIPANDLYKSFGAKVTKYGGGRALATACGLFFANANLPGVYKTDQNAAGHRCWVFPPRPVLEAELIKRGWIIDTGSEDGPQGVPAHVAALIAKRATGEPLDEFELLSLEPEVYANDEAFLVNAGAKPSADSWREAGVGLHVSAALAAVFGPVDDDGADVAALDRWRTSPKNGDDYERGSRRPWLGVERP